jgi:hypothetical protein
VAEADDADPSCGNDVASSARTASNARLAESPAGPPQYAVIWNSNSSSSSAVTPARGLAAAWSLNSSIRPSAAVMARTRRLRSRVLSAPPRAQTPQAMDVR